MRRPSLSPGLALLIAVGSIASCGGDGGDAHDDTTTPDAGDEIWTAPPRRACSADQDCQDDDACTWDEKCGADGLCVFRVLTCDDANACTSDTCDSALGCVFEPFVGACDDGDPCTLGDMCKDGACFPSELLSCDDANPCTSDSCDRDSGACRHEPESDIGNSDCDDGDACTESGRCDAGRCVYEPVVCPTSTTCKAWSCDATRGCVATNLDGPCTDGDACTTGDVCTAGVCGGAARACDDGDPCTTDGCDPQAGCTTTDNTAPCDDGIACTTGDRCAAGVCTSGPDACDDGNPCTLDVCAGLDGCRHYPAVGACSDGDPCTVGEHCVAGACAGATPAACDDGLGCTVDSCSAVGANPVCGHTPLGGCIDSDQTVGQYYGLFRFGFDATAADPDAFDCLGTTAPTLVDGSPDGISGAASCTWDTAIAANKTVLATYNATDTGQTVFVDLGPYTVTARHFVGTIETSGALVTSLPLDVFLTVDFGNPTLLAFADGSGSAPPSNQPKAVSITLDVEVSDVAVPLCCRDDGTCFPGNAATCASVGAAVVAPSDSGSCCLDGPAAVTCVDTPASWCEATPGALFLGSKPSACCLDGGCALLSADDCAAAGGSYSEGLDCGDADLDGFADVCPAPLGCGQPGLATCALVGGALRITPTGLITIPLFGVWNAAGTNRWSSPDDISFDVLGHPVSITVPGDVTVDCNDGVSVTGQLLLPDLSVAGFDLSSPEATTPTFTLSYRLGQDLASLDAPLSDCRTYLTFEGDSTFTIGEGDDQSVLAAGSHIVLAVDPSDPAFFASAEGAILDGPSHGLVRRVGFGISRGGNLKWSSEFPVPPAPGLPPVGMTLFGHVYAEGDFDIPLPGGVVRVQVDGESVYDLGPFPSAAEAVLAGILGGDIGAIDDALTTLGSGLESGEVLDELAYGVNAHSIKLAVEGKGTFTFARGTVIVEHEQLRFAAQVGNLATVLPDDVPAELVALLDRLSVKQVYGATGIVDADGFEVRLSADLTFGPVKLERAGLIIGYRNGHFSVSVDQPALSFGFLGWLETFKDFVGCDFQLDDDISSAGCSVGGIPIGSIALETHDGRFVLTLKATLPGDMGDVTFTADVSKSGQFTLTGNAQIPIGPFRSADVTLVLTQAGVRFIGTIADISTSMTFDGLVYFDGSFVLQGLGSMKLLTFITLDTSATLSYCPAGSACAQAGGVVGDLVLLVTGDVDTPVGTATLAGEMVYDDGVLLYDLTGDADFAVGGFADLQGTLRVTNHGTPGAFLHLDLDLVVVTGVLDGELHADGGFTLAGNGTLKIPGFTDLASATIDISSERGVTVATTAGVAGARLAISGRVAPDGFVFTGWNHIDLLGFQVDGQATLQGDDHSAELRFAGAVDVGGNAVSVSGLVSSSGQFSFTGQSTLALFGYQLTQAQVQFDNSGLSLAGRMNVLGIATFQMSGRVQSNSDFELTAGATAATFPGGLSGQLDAHIVKQGVLVTVAGAGYATFAGANASGSFRVSSSGQFAFTGSLGFDWSGGNLSLGGNVTVSASSSGYSASAQAKACADFIAGKGCASVGGSVDSGGNVCVKFPIVGTKCVDII